MSPLELFDQALERASNPSNPPSAVPRSPDDPPPTAIDPSLNKPSYGFDGFCLLHGATSASNIQWQPMSPVLGTISSYQPPLRSQYDYAPPRQDPGPCKNFRNPEDGESESRQRALDQSNRPHLFGGISNHPGSQFYAPQLGFAGEPSQSKPSATDDLFSDVEEDELPDFEDPANEENDQANDGTELAPTQHAYDSQNNGLFGNLADFIANTRDTHPDERDKAQEMSTVQTRDFQYQPRVYSPLIGHPSPTESQLIAEQFEFHNELPEETQIAQFGDKAFRKALREVRPELPRKQQWYAWNKVRQLMSADARIDGEAENLANEHLSYAPSALVEKPMSRDHEEDCLWAVDAEPLSPRSTVLGSHDKMSEKDLANRQQGVAHLPCSTTLSSPASRGHASAAAAPGVVAELHSTPSSIQTRHESIDRLREHPHGWLINKIATENRARKENEVILVNDLGSDEAIKDISQAFQGPAPISAGPIHSQQTISGLNRPDTPRPDTPRRDSIRQSVEPETPFRDRVRESTPAFEDRSPGPSPASHTGADVDMLDASDASTPPPPVPSIPRTNLPPISSPDVISSPIHTVTAPETPLPTSSPVILPRSQPPSPTKWPQPQARPQSRSPSRSRSPSKLPPIPAPAASTPRSAKRGRRKSAVASGKVDKPKSRNVTRKVTAAVAKVGDLVKKEGGKVAEAVKRIEDGLSRVSPRRSGRIAAARMV